MNDQDRRQNGAEYDTGCTRRELLRTMAGGALLVGAGSALPLFSGCATTSWAWRPEEQALLASADDALEIPPVGTPEAAVLRRRACEIEPGADLGPLESLLRASLERAGGVGLAAPQVGVSVRAVLVTLDARSDAPRTVWCLNPRIERRSDELQDDIEGCLSIPDVCGLVRRNWDLRVRYHDGTAEAELELSGFDARIFQHEIDHLDGVLFTDRLLGSPAPKDALRPLREELKRRREQGLAGDVLAPEQIAELWATLPTLLVETPEEE